ncbi:hypothetical protein FVEN_g6198 [Fusarium venenatum]|uniref:Cutinase n=1 Tax=Fusarium venenatum TaxID=56646 RepID=A0A2L2T3Q7_9HYPO|nr:uncharacterized protein FVRRES_01894 [Fusarium venenatum]KAG8355926.1 hypothetical protein FVEN_g6198 [Fusarium venenatum]KAH7004961.1 cutinase-domain-containing protein [Fusarium venenatum]CEI65382.1 unnamed protein product [Fusarium venenatum]
MLYTSIIVALVPFAVAGPIAPRAGLGSGLPGLGGGSGSGLPSLPSLGGGSGSGLPKLPGLGGGSGAGGLPSLPSLGGGSGSGGLPSLPGLGGDSGSGSGLPSLPGLGGGSGSGLPSLPGLGGGSGGLPSIPGLGGDDSSDESPSATAPSVVAPTASPQTSPTAPSGSTGGSAGTDGPASRRGFFDGGSSGSGSPLSGFLGSGGSSSGGSSGDSSSGGASSSPFGSFLGSGAGGLGGSTMNDLSGDCKDVTVIFARGTTEAGNVGTAAGPPFFKALGEKIGQDKLAVQGVDYSASVAGIMQMGDKAGSEKMASLVTEAAKKCPKTKIVMSGYSQGAMLVHNAARALPAETTAKVAAVLNFGDPFQRQAIQGVSADKVKIICHAGDGVCAGTAAITPDHLTYSKDAGAAAEFVASKVQ